MVKPQGRLMSYGKELILDIHACNAKKFTRESIKSYFKKLCQLIDMEACDLHFWDDVGVPEEEKQTEAHTKGTSAIQFILTSNITIHTLDLLEKVFVNIFSCKDFDANVAAAFTEEWFDGTIQQKKVIDRI